MTAYKTHPDRFLGLLSCLNKVPLKIEEGKQTILLRCAELLLKAKPNYERMAYAQRLAFHAKLGKLVLPVLDGARIKVRPFRRTWGIGVQKSAKISPGQPLLIFKPRYARHFYELLQLASDFDDVARFTRCPRCNRFFLAKRKGTKFCSVVHAAEFHNRQPDRKSKVKEAVARHRSRKMKTEREPALRRFVLRVKPKEGDWPSLVEVWNEGCGGKRTWKFKSVGEFKRECKRVLT